VGDWLREKRDMNEQSKSLIRAYADGVITPEQFEELQRALLTDSSVREQFLHELNVHAALEDVALGESSPIVSGDGSDRRDPVSLPATASWQRRMVRWPLAVAAVAVVALIAVMLSLRPNRGPEGVMPKGQPAIMTITDVGGSVQWTGDGGRIRADLEVGQSLSGGVLESLSADSWGELQFRDGSTVTISGVSALTISAQGQKRLHLAHGKLSASVTRQSVDKPMLVYTPTAELKVLGTQFNVDAESSTTVLAVNEGLVCLKRLTDGREVEVPAKHQAVASIDEENGLKVTRRNVETNSWRSDLAREATHGEWWPDLRALGVKLKKAVIAGKVTEEDAMAKYKAAANLSDEGGILFAKPWLVKPSKSGSKADLSCLVVLSVSRGQAVPVVLNAGSTFRVRGQMKSSTDVTFGLVTYAPGGGFAGKYSATRKIETSGPGGDFDVELPLSDFQPVAVRENSSTSPIGNELTEWWCVTKGKKVGFGITHVELLSPALAP